MQKRLNLGFCSLPSFIWSFPILVNGWFHSSSSDQILATTKCRIHSASQFCQPQVWTTFRTQRSPNLEGSSQLLPTGLKQQTPSYLTFLFYLVSHVTADLSLNCINQIRLFVNKNTLSILHLPHLKFPSIWIGPKIPHKSCQWPYFLLLSTLFAFQMLAHFSQSITLDIL